MSRSFSALLLLLSAPALPLAAQTSRPYPTPAYADPAGRAARLKQAFPELERLAAEWARQRGVPGMSWGVVIDGETALIRTLGSREWDARQPVEPGTAFRIASMTKSFTALAILKLRDEGKLSLDDEVARWIPEIGRFRYPTGDTAPIQVRQLLTHGAGFPEDNPWGDQQLGASDATVTAWLERGIPWSTPPDTEFEYSNYGFGLLGRIVSKASGRDYRDYLEAEILKPLGMTSSTLEPKGVEAIAAVGYRKGASAGTFRVEPSLPHGAFGAMGGLVTTAPDLARYVAFHLDAYPPRDGPETGPVRRASVREMHRMWRMSDLSVRRAEPESGLSVRASGYGFGLSIARDCRFAHIVGHGGGLPGFGSYMLWLPGYGVGLFAMTNLTYAGPASLLNDMLDTLRGTGALTARATPASPVLTEFQQKLFALWNNWDQAAADRIAANNLFLDRAAADRQSDIAALKKLVGSQCSLAGPVRPENWLRGEFDVTCERGAIVRMSFTLAPTPEPTLQFWSLRPVMPLSPSLRDAAARVALGKLPAGANRGLWKARVETFHRAYGDCKLGPPLLGDGVKQTVVQLDCARGRAELSLTAAAGNGNKVSSLSIARHAEDTCVP